MSIQVITIANAAPKEPYYCFEEMKASVRKYGHEPLILGWEQPWGGLASKPRILKKAIENGQITAEHIIFIDAFDVVLAASPEEIVEAFKSFDADIVWNAEKNCFPVKEIACDYPPTDSPFKYLNSGFCVSRTELMWKLLDHMKADELKDDHKDENGNNVHPNDQEYYSLAFVRGCPGVVQKLDYNARLCMCMVDVGLNDLSFEEVMTGKPCVTHKYTATFPAAFHWAGGSKTSGTMEPILKHLGLR